MTTERNAELLRAVGDYIAAHPSLYDQGEWLQETDCGTHGCVAGLAVHLAEGYEPNNRGHGSTTTTPDGELTTTQRAARKALGLFPAESSLLFAGAWRPVGWKTVPSEDEEAVARLVRDALHALADGARVADVSEKW